MNKQRLLKMAKFIRTIPAKNFAMKSWWQNEEGMKNNKCGTVGCAMGHAANSKLFPGLRLSHSYDSEWYVLCDEKCYFPKYKYSEGFDAATKLFGISHNEADFLFGHDSYPDSRVNQPSYIAKRIEAFVRSNGNSYEKWSDKYGWM